MLKIYNRFFYRFLGAVLVLFVAASCSSDSKKDVPHESLQGLWVLKETVYYPLNIDVPAEDGEGEGEDTGEGAPSGAAALGAGPAEEDGSQIYPSEEGVQPYLRLRNSRFDFFEVRLTDTLFHYADRPYSNSNTELNFDIASTSLLTMGYSIDRNKLFLIRVTEQFEIVHQFEKMSSDPFIDEEEEEETPELPVNGCSANHNAEAAPGSTANPFLLTMNKDTTVHLIPTTAANGYETRLYLEVKTARPYRIVISDYASESDFTSVLSYFHYFELSATEGFASEYFLFTPLRINKGDVTGKSVDFFPAGNCLYIRLFSYVDDLNVSLRVEPLFEEDKTPES